jgi:hypothetical protein
MSQRTGVKETKLVAACSAGWNVVAKWAFGVQQVGFKWSD